MSVYELVGIFKLGAQVEIVVTSDKGQVTRYKRSSERSFNSVERVARASYKWQVTRGKCGVGVKRCDCTKL